MAVVGDVLETIQYLEAMKPEGGATKEKRIKEFKRIQTMKRKSLNDLFKALKYMGQLIQAIFSQLFFMISLFVCIAP